MSTPPPPPHSPRQNRILAALPQDVYARLAGDLEYVELAPAEIVHETGENREFAYFPTTSILALIVTTRSGASTALAMTGRDGIIGIPLVLGGDSMTHAVVVQCAGGAYRIRGSLLHWELEQHGGLQLLCLRYTQALMAQMAQSIVCNRHHTIAQQLRRWLLLSLDLRSDNQLDVTHELIARMLGVRREGITEAAGHLQGEGLIHYHRGHVTVLDRAGLEAGACECYGVVRKEYERLFGMDRIHPPRHRDRLNPATLRRRAEARLAQEAQEAQRAERSNWETERLLHELEVHQIELEMQLEELHHAYDESDALRKEYADVYDFAPVGYLTLNTEGVITSINLAGAILLGIKHSQQGRHRLVSSIKPEFLAVFERFQHQVLEGRSKAKCQLVLQTTPQRAEVAVRLEGVTNEAGTESRLVMMELIPANGSNTDPDPKERE